MESNIGKTIIVIDPSSKFFLMKGVIENERVGMNNTPILDIRFGENAKISYGWHMFCLEEDYDE